MNVCLLSTSSAFIGGSQNGCDAVDVVVFVVDVDDARSMKLRLSFSLDFTVDVELAIHSSVFVTSESFGRGAEA